MTRLFAGIPVPEPARSELGTLLADLSRSEWPVRWVRPEGLHLTLKFFGWVDDAVAEALVPALVAAAEGIGPIPITCRTVGAFPSGRRARVIWIGLEAPAALELLQDAVERVSVPLGFPVEGRPFMPHITLGRVKPGERLRAGGPDDLPPSGEISFLAEQLVLFESRPGREGSVYSPRHSITLAPCAAV